MTKIMAQDGYGQPIEGIVLEPPQVEIVIPIEEQVMMLDDMALECALRCAREGRDTIASHLRSNPCDMELQAAVAQYNGEITAMMTELSKRRIAKQGQRFFIGDVFIFEYPIQISPTEFKSERSSYEIVEIGRGQYELKDPAGNIDQISYADLEIGLIQGHIKKVSRRIAKMGQDDYGYHAKRIIDRMGWANMKYSPGEQDVREVVRNYMISDDEAQHMDFIKLVDAVFNWFEPAMPLFEARRQAQLTESDAGAQVEILADGEYLEISEGTARGNTIPVPAGTQGQLVDVEDEDSLIILPSGLWVSVPVANVKMARQAQKYNIGEILEQKDPTTHATKWMKILDIKDGEYIVGIIDEQGGLKPGTYETPVVEGDADMTVTRIARTAQQAADFEIGDKVEWDLGSPFGPSQGVVRGYKPVSWSDDDIVVVEDQLGSERMLFGDQLTKIGKQACFWQLPEIKGMPQPYLDMEIARIGMVAELDATSLYEWLAELAADPQLKATLMDIAGEEKTHTGEFNAILSRLDPQQMEEDIAGAEEVGQILNDLGLGVNSEEMEYPDE